MRDLEARDEFQTDAQTRAINQFTYTGALRHCDEWHARHLSPGIGSLFIQRTTGRANGNEIVIKQRLERQPAARRDCSGGKPDIGISRFHRLQNTSRQRIENAQVNIGVFRREGLEKAGQKARCHRGKACNCQMAMPCRQMGVQFRQAVLGDVQNSLCNTNEGLP